MRILRVRRGFQADHSSSSYVFYAADHPVSAAGQKVAHRYSSRAEVDERYARYVKWGDSSLSSEAYPALLDEHYDIMVEESYGWWTLMMAVPGTPAMKAALNEFAEARGDNDQGVDVDEYHKRMVVTVFCQFENDGVEFLEGDYYDSDVHEKLIELLTEVRAELIAGDTSFLSAVATFYNAFDEDEGESAEDDEASSPAALDDLSKAELQAECERRNLDYKKSWTKSRLREALAPKPKARPRAGAAAGRRKLSRAAQTIVDQLVSL